MKKVDENEEHKLESKKAIKEFNRRREMAKNEIK